MLRLPTQGSHGKSKHLNGSLRTRQAPKRLLRGAKRRDGGKLEENRAEFGGPGGFSICISRDTRLSFFLHNLPRFHPIDRPAASQRITKTTCIPRLASRALWLCPEQLSILLRIRVQWDPWGQKGDTNDWGTAKYLVALVNATWNEQPRAS
ncbi:hypothetical protein FA13DRAFT_180879 [Coprinellus micaceus]|uniref:Uncharacterized protein n=1 Tax=Coprinellus micaceus TaxID=71717 RepID=A0A4Y7THK6_COPMI|nr:hypothetical protein FA13DRAFT_180879 [Coprinellus micaceus]